MLPANVLQCIRETIKADLRPRNRTVRDRVLGSDRTIASRQGALSGAAVAARAQIGCDELTVRAEIIWSIIQRCHKSFGFEPRGVVIIRSLRYAAIFTFDGGDCRHALARSGAIPSSAR